MDDGQKANLRLAVEQLMFIYGQTQVVENLLHSKDRPNPIDGLSEYVFDTIKLIERVLDSLSDSQEVA